MISDDPRRVALAEAMEAHDGARCHVERTDGGPLAANEGGDALSLALAYNALPAAAELIEELTAKAAEAHAGAACSGGRIAEAIGTLRDYTDPHATVEGEAVDLLDRTIATQAKEIEHHKKRVTQLLDEAADADEAEQRLLDKCNDRIEQVNEQAKEIERLRKIAGTECDFCKGTGRHKDPMWTSDTCPKCSGRGRLFL